MRKITFLLFLFSMALVSSCSSSGSNTKTANTKPAANADFKKGVAPVADPEIAVIEMENGSAYGTIKLELIPTSLRFRLLDLRNLQKKATITASRSTVSTRV